MTIEDRLQNIRDKWFLMDTGYFMVICTHVVEINNGIGCPIAVGGGHIYINGDFFEDKSDRFLEESLKVEIIRILLKHPYQRQLPNAIKMYIASNFVVANNTDFKEMHLKKPSEAGMRNGYGLDDECLEMIYDSISFPELQKQKGDSSMMGNGSGSSISNNGNGNGNGSGKNKQGQGGNGKDDSNQNGGSNGQAGGSKGDQNDPLKDWDDGCSSTDDAAARVQFWKEDELKITEVNALIGKIEKTTSWGTMPGDMISLIKKSIEPKFNYKALFHMFRSSVISSNRTLTRMKPNRRYGYNAMGSKRGFTTSILVAVDNSGSISDEELQLAVGFINKFFKYGIDRIDTIQFDHEIHPKTLEKLTKKITKYNVEGRGGTDFNGVFKYAQEDNPIYDGVIIITDGYASVPDERWLHNNYRNTRYLWCLNSEETWKYFTSNSRNKDGFAKFGKATYVAKQEKA